MVHINLITVLATAAVAWPSVMAAPLTKRAIALQNYADFQISDGTTGKAQAAANALFVDPFNGTDLASVSSSDLNNLNTMARAAVDAEANFNTAIAAASGDTATALQAGKIANKVLKLTGEIQALKIKAAQGDTSAGNQVTEEQTKLATNIKTDESSPGSPMSSFLSVGGGSTSSGSKSTKSN